MQNVFRSRFFCECFFSCFSLFSCAPSWTVSSDWRHSVIFIIWWNWINLMPNDDDDGTFHIFFCFHHEIEWRMLERAANLVLGRRCCQLERSKLEKDRRKRTKKKTLFLFKILSNCINLINLCYRKDQYSKELCYATKNPIISKLYPTLSNCRYEKPWSLIPTLSKLVRFGKCPPIVRSRRARIAANILRNWSQIISFAGFEWRRY